MFQGTFEQAQPAIQTYLDALGWGQEADPNDEFWGLPDEDLIVVRESDNKIGILEPCGTFHTA
jgi:hypothetical protein